MTNLITVRYTSHARHDTEDVVVNSVYTDLGSGSSSNGGGRENELENGVINAGEVAAAAGLVLLRAESEGVYVDACIGVTGMVLEGLDYIEVGSLTLREAVLAIELELGSYYRVLTPAVHVQSSLREDEGARIRDKGAELVLACNIGLVAKGKVICSRCGVVSPAGTASTAINGTGKLEEA